MSDKKNIESIDFDDDSEAYEEFEKYLSEDTERKKVKTAKLLNSQAEYLLAEIEQKKENQKPLREKYVKYILKHEKNKYNEKMLNMLSFEDVVSIYDEIKTSKNVFSKFFDFFFGV